MNKFIELQEGDRVAKLLGVDTQDLYKNLLKPRIKVGNEFVTQGRNKDQVSKLLNNTKNKICSAVQEQLISSLFVCLGPLFCWCLV